MRSFWNAFRRAKSRARASLKGWDARSEGRQSSMIRILQQDNKATKIIFAVIIGAACLSMVAYLIPGIGDNVGAGNGAGVYATVRDPGVLGRFTAEPVSISTQDVTQMAQMQLQRQKLPDFLMPYMMTRAGQILVQQAILKHEADRNHLQVSDEDL